MGHRHLSSSRSSICTHFYKKMTSRTHSTNLWLLTTSYYYLILTTRAIFTWVSKAFRICFGFTSLRLLIGLKISHHFFIHSDVKPKPIMSRSGTFSRASHTGPVHPLLWFTRFFVWNNNKKICCLFQNCPKQLINQLDAEKSFQAQRINLACIWLVETIAANN